jgi:hypothetical protein
VNRLRILGLLLLVVAGVVGCPPVKNAAKLNEYDGQLRGLRTAGDSGEAKAKRAAIAKQALSTAQTMNPTTNDEKFDQVAWYRLAAVASVEAQSLGAPTLAPSSDGGTAACAALPNGPASRPLDCTLVRLAFPIGVVQDLDAKALTLTTKRDAARAAGQRLGPDDLTEARRLFGGFESELDRVTKIATSLPPGLDPAFKRSVENDEVAIYCRLPPIIRTALAADGQTVDTVKPLSDRKEAARKKIEPRLGTINCMNPGPMALPQ